jgi:hypothetical protein
LNLKKPREWRENLNKNSIKTLNIFREQGKLNKNKHFWKIMFEKIKVKELGNSGRLWEGGRVCVSYMNMPPYVACIWNRKVRQEQSDASCNAW